MKIETQQHIAKSPEDVYRIISDFGNWVPGVDSDVISMKRQTDGPIAVGTKWIEIMKVPGNTIEVDIWITAIDPGKSIDVEFDNNAMNGTGRFSVSPSGANGEGSDVTMSLDSSIKFWRGWLFYPMIRMDFPKRERNRLAALKNMVESGEIEAPGTIATPASE